MEYGGRDKENGHDSTEALKDSAGRIKSPLRTYFLKLAGRFGCAVIFQRDEDGLRYARKGMIISALVQSSNGLWEISHLTSELQRIVIKNKAISHACRLEAMGPE